jgi:acyl carrier protein
MKQLEDQVLEIVHKFCSAEIKEKITLDTPLDETEIDSLTMSEIIFEIEDVLGVPVPEGDGPMFRTLREICAALAASPSPAKAVNA